TAGEDGPSPERTIALQPQIAVDRMVSAKQRRVIEVLGQILGKSTPMMVIDESAFAICREIILPILREEVLRAFPTGSFPFPLFVEGTSIQLGECGKDALGNPGGKTSLLCCDELVLEILGHAEPASKRDCLLNGIGGSGAVGA